VLLNLIYNLGIEKLLVFKKTINHIHNENFALAAEELADSNYIA